MNAAVPAAPAASSTPAGPKGAGGRALDWWRYYCDPSRDGHDPGTRAQLRRCDSPVDAAAIPAAVSLAHRLGTFKGEGEDWRVTAALNLARVLAHVREHTGELPMRAAGWKTFVGDRTESEAGEDRPRLSEVRFRRLLTTGPGEEQVTAFVRLIALLDATANVAALGDAFLEWEHPYRGERLRKRWAEDYFAARSSRAPAESAPTTTPAPAEDDDA